MRQRRTYVVIVLVCGLPSLLGLGCVLLLVYYAKHREHKRFTQLAKDLKILRDAGQQLKMNKETMAFEEREDIKAYAKEARRRATLEKERQNKETAHARKGEARLRWKDAGHRALIKAHQKRPMAASRATTVEAKEEMKSTLQKKSPSNARSLRGSPWIRFSPRCATRRSGSASNPWSSS